MARTGNTYEKWLRGDNLYKINIQGRIMVHVHCPSPHCQLSYNLYTNCILNANNSFKVICWTRYRTEGLSEDYMLPPLKSMKMS